MRHRVADTPLCLRESAHDSLNSFYFGPYFHSEFGPSRNESVSHQVYGLAMYRPEIFILACSVPPRKTPDHWTSPQLTPRSPSRVSHHERLRVGRIKRSPVDKPCLLPDLPGATRDVVRSYIHNGTKPGIKCIDIPRALTLRPGSRARFVPRCDRFIAPSDVCFPVYPLPPF